jgi:hypothetical protein
MTGNIGAPNSIMRRVAELPKPSEPRVSHSISTATPWGRAQSATYYANGLISYTTSSHGGFHVSWGLQRRIPSYLRTIDAWYEEDCEWAIPAVVFPEYFSLRDRLLAIETMQRWFPELWVRYMNEYYAQTSTAGEAQ